MSQKLGPLPVWAWLGVGVLALAAWWYLGHRSTGSSPAPASAQQISGPMQAYASRGAAGGDSGGGDTGGSSGVPNWVAAYDPSAVPVGYAAPAPGTYGAQSSGQLIAPNAPPGYNAPAPGSAPNQVLGYPVGPIGGGRITGG